MRYIYGVPEKKFAVTRDCLLAAYQDKNWEVMLRLAQNHGSEFINAPMYHRANDEDQTPCTLLHYAIMDNNHGMISFLINQLGSNPHVVRGTTDDALTLAVRHRCFRVVNELFLAGVHPLRHTPVTLANDGSGVFTPLKPVPGSALHLALKKKSHDHLAAFFLQMCDKINSDQCWVEKDGYRVTLLSKPMYYQLVASSIHHPPKEWQKPSLAFAFAAKGLEHSFFHMYLRDRALDPNRGVDSLGNTPLHLAILKLTFDEVNALISIGANPHRPNTAGLTPLAMLSLPRSHIMAPRILTDRDIAGITSIIACYDRIFAFPMSCIQKWSTLKAPPAAPCIMRVNEDPVDHFRGRPFHGWHALPTDVVRKIMLHMLPKYHWRALFSRLSIPLRPRPAMSRKRGIDDARRGRGEFQEPIPPKRFALAPH